MTGAPLHVAVIMDGNGRWATARGLPRLEGHRAGGRALRTVIAAAPGLGIGTLTAYAFSADNWRRPAAEVRALLALFDEALRRDVLKLRREGVRLSVIGRRDRLPPALVRRIAGAEATTERGSRLHLRLAIDYSARDAIARAAAAGQEAGTPVTRANISLRVGSGRGHVHIVPDVDLLIRTGGEQRLSDFLLWESAYAELWFTPTPWPAFGADDLARAVADFRGRQRRFGGLAETVNEPVQVPL